MIFKLACLGVFSAAVAAADLTPQAKNIEIAAGVFMPRVNLGTCCGSQPKVGLGPWMDAGGNGVDTAFDYGKLCPGGLQSDIAAILEARQTKRDAIFITTKIPAGLGLLPSDCLTATADSALKQVKENLKELNVDQVDLVLLHAPCKVGGHKADARLWAGLEQALAQNLTRAIGVSNYKQKDLEALLSTASVVPAVNQCEMSVANHDDSTISFSQSHNITYEAYNAMKGCPFSNAEAQAIASKHGVGLSQVCLRYILQRGCIMAVGTGENASTVGEYAREDLDIFGFELTDAEMQTLGNVAAQF